MKRIISEVLICVSVALFCMRATSVLAQEYQQQTLIDRMIEHGGFGGPVVKFTEINEDFALLVGGRGGWIVDHTFIIGGGGYGLSNEFKIEPDHLNWGMGYGGLELEYVYRSHELVHFSVQTLIGAGGVAYQDHGDWYDEDWNGDGFFVAEPGVNVLLNVIENFRIGLGASYRYIDGINEDETDFTSDSDLSGPSAVLTFKFGIF